MLTHHVVLETPSIKNVLDCCSAADCRSFIVGNACGADCGAAAAFGKKEISMFLLFLSFFFTFDLLSIVLNDVG